VAVDSPDQLIDKYRNVCTSIQNQRGFAPGDIETIKQLRDEMHDWNSSNDDFKTTAAELQLTIWLGETQKCNVLFEKLISLQPENTNIALAWADFMLSQDEADHEAIYQDLISRYPNSPEIAIDWVTFLESKNRFTDAIQVIGSLTEDVSNTPEILQLYAAQLYADNRFSDALNVLAQIDSEELATNPLLSSKVDSATEKYKKAETKWEKELSIRETEESADDLPRARIITSRGPIELELFEDHATNTVSNFISLAESGYYDGTRFHRVLPKFMAQGGDPNSREGAEGEPGSGGPGYTIKDEHTLEDHRNHFAGSLSMAKTSAPDSGGSQFFLTHLPTSHLDGRHTVFGRILSGLDIARSLEPNDDIVTVTITRKREHEYIPDKIGDKTAEVPKKPKTPTIKPTIDLKGTKNE
jgi:peptidyl-prolyl cis-trans isomerase B (cyclophilin B)